MSTTTQQKMMQSAGLALLAAAICSTPALAGQNAEKKSCFWQAELVRPALTQPEKEAFIANCKADLTATQGKKAARRLLSARQQNRNHRVCAERRGRLPTLGERSHAGSCRAS